MVWDGGGGQGQALDKTHYIDRPLKSEVINPIPPLKLFITQFNSVAAVCKCRCNDPNSSKHAELFLCQFPNMLRIIVLLKINVHLLISRSPRVYSDTNCYENKT